MSDFKQQSYRMRIRSIYGEFSEKERLLADFILDSPEQIIHGTINQIADHLHLADSTVFRFCKKIGYQGFQDLKIALASEATSAAQDIHENVSKQDDEQTILEKVFRSNIKTLEDTLEVVDEAEFKQAANVLMNARKIEFFGFGGSNIIALDGYHKFVRSGLQVSAQADSHLQLMSASQMTKQDVGILISHTGRSKDILEIQRTLKEKEVTTIGVTGFTQSPLSKQVDISLFTFSEETDYRSEALASRIAQLSLMDALYVTVMMALEEKGKESIYKMRHAIKQRRVIE